MRLLANGWADSSGSLTCKQRTVCARAAAASPSGDCVCELSTSSMLQPAAPVVKQVKQGNYRILMAHVTKTIRGYGADTREYAGNTRIDIHAPNSVCRVYASSRGNIKGYQSSHKYSQIRGLDIRRYADIRGHSHRFTVTYPRMALVTSALGFTTSQTYLPG